MKTQIIAWGIFPRTLAGAADQDAVVMDDNPVDRRVVPLTVLADRLRRREGRSGQSRSLRKQIVPPRPADLSLSTCRLCPAATVGRSRLGLQSRVTGKA